MVEILLIVNQCQLTKLYADHTPEFMAKCIMAYIYVRKHVMVDIAFDPDDQHQFQLFCKAFDISFMYLKNKVVI